jgi:hypothetical protein
MNRPRFLRPQLLLAVVAFLVAPSVASAQYSGLNEPSVHHHEDFVTAIDQTHDDSYHSDYDLGSACCDGFRSRPHYFTRTIPPGTLSQHYPYDALRFYYYDRPYNSYHVDRRYENKTSHFSDNPNQPYSKRIYDSIYERVERQIADNRILSFPDVTSNISMESAQQQIARDKNFEYADWQKHYRSRLAWENKRMIAEDKKQLLESPIELRDVSHPYER